MTACALGCTFRGRHADGCQDQACTGCLPRPALARSVLCAASQDRVYQDLSRLPDLHRELLQAHQPYRSGPAGDITTGTAERKIPIRDKPADARDHLLRVLIRGVEAIIEERNFTPPTLRTVRRLTDYVLANHTWLVEQRWAASYANALHQAISEAWQVAYPNGTRTVAVGTCREIVACDVATRQQQTCPGEWVARIRPGDDLFPARIACTEVPEHEWNAGQPGGWAALVRRVERSVA